VEESRLTTQDELTLDNMLRELHYLRIHRKELNDLYIDEKNKFNELHKELVCTLDMIQDQVHILEDKLKDCALLVYNNNPEQGKDIYKNIKERDVKVVEYKDVHALSWCIEHQMFLKYDKVALDTYIRNMKEEYRPSFANVSTKCTITLPMNIKD